MKLYDKLGFSHTSFEFKMIFVLNVKIFFNNIQFQILLFRYLNNYIQKIFIKIFKGPLLTSRRSAPFPLAIGFNAAIPAPSRVAEYPALSRAL